MISLRVVSLHIITGLFCLLSSTASAQEIQRSFDEAGTIQVIDRALEEELQLFPDYEGFREARLFQVSETAYVLEIVYQPDEEVLRDRQKLTVAEVSELRARVTDRYRALKKTPPINHEGRTELLVSSTLLSLGFYGYALPMALSIESSAGQTATYMLTSGAGFFGPYLWTRERSVTEGQAKLFQYGGTRGIAHGAFIGLLMAGEDLSTEGFMGAALLISLTEGLLGYRTAGTRQMTQGTAETIGVGGDFGLSFGLGTAYLIAKRDPGARLVAAPSLIGSAVGIMAGHRLSRSTTYTTGDARVLRLMGGLGGLAGWTAADLTGTDNSRTIVGSAMAASLIGLGLSQQMLHNKNFSGSDGTFITLGTLGGMLTGQGIAYIITGDDYDEGSETPFITLGTLGAVGGFALMYNVFADDARMQQTGWNIRLNPTSLAARWLPKRSKTGSVRPIVTIQRTF